MMESAPTPQATAGPSTNTMALVSLIAGIVGLTIFPFVGSIVAVITGNIGPKGNRRQRRGPERRRIGSGRAHHGMDRRRPGRHWDLPGVPVLRPIAPRNPPRSEPKLRPADSVWAVGLIKLPADAWRESRP